MPKINVNLESVPDVIQPVDPGVYLLVVREANIANVEKDGKITGQKLVLVMAIDDEASPNHGRQIWDHIGLKGMGLTSLKRAAKAAGVTFGADGLDAEDFIGKHLKARVKNSTYTDASSGEVKESSKIADYLFE